MIISHFKSSPCDRAVFEINLFKKRYRINFTVRLIDSVNYNDVEDKWRPLRENTKPRNTPKRPGVIVSLSFPQEANAYGRKNMQIKLQPTG